jgi:hypothetical protein
MSENFEKEIFDELLEKFNQIEFKEKKDPTFLEIIKKSDKENVWSNILAFYFDPKKEHKLDDLLLKSFFEALDKNFELKSRESIKVHTEYPTDNGKRIDLLIEADNFVLGIENKVNHFSNNPYEDYARKIDDIANGRKTFKVVLSKSHLHDERGFVNLTYDRFIKSIKLNLPQYKAKADNEYLTFLNDFLRNIENAINFKDMIDNKESLEYFQKNYTQIEQLAVKFLKFKEQVRQTFANIHTAIDLSDLVRAFKIKYGEDSIIRKESIFDQDINGFPIFRIVIDKGKTINYWIYLDSEMSQIYCYAEPKYISHEEIFEETENFGLVIKISDEPKVAAHNIVAQIKEIVNIVFED